ncbi:MAG: TrmH family RNA methyltransferase [Rhodospirillaceae bacterium]|nr:TrmH family RNA methyltransferase [Rhodospirillaceae bacterium]
MKGYFGIGIEGASKAVNVGSLFRTAHAFGASFVFTVRAQYNRRDGGASDTSDTPRSVPTYHFADLQAFRLPLGCRLVGVEITDDAIELPSFRHPRQAAYILGSEREGLSAEMQSHCDYVVKIPTRFSINLGVAGALILYDRLISLGRHAPRAVGEGAPTEAAPLPVFGDPIYRRKRLRRQKSVEKQ